VRARTGDALRGLARLVRITATLAGWIVVGGVWLGFVATVAAPERAGDRADDALWGGAALAILLLFGGRVLLARVLDALGRALQRNRR
jgi:hypothetical protein